MLVKVLMTLARVIKIRSGKYSPRIFNFTLVRYRFVLFPSSSLLLLYYPRRVSSGQTFGKKSTAAKLAGMYTRSARYTQRAANGYKVSIFVGGYVVVFCRSRPSNYSYVIE